MGELDLLLPELDMTGTPQETVTTKAYMFTTRESAPESQPPSVSNWTAVNCRLIAIMNDELERHDVRVSIY